METSLRAPIDPSAPTRNLGTMNSEMPLVPAGPPGILASTRCTMFSDISCSAPEIHILEPNSRKVPSSAGSARVTMSASDDPACGSESAMVPVNRPASIGVTNASICSALPNLVNRLALAMVSIR